MEKVLRQPRSKFLAMGLALALCLAPAVASATEAKKPTREEPVYHVLVSIDRRCEATVHVENLQSGWNRDYILNAAELDAAMAWSEGVGKVATKSVVLVDYARDFGAAFRGGTNAGLYAIMLSAVSTRIFGDPGKCEFISGNDFI